MKNNLSILLVLILSSTNLCAQDAPCPSISFKDFRDGQVYKVIKIGNQCWMAENMRYHTSDTILGGLDTINVNYPNESYGRLYNWVAVQSVCPKGWHLPSDGEWNKLERYLGMPPAEANTSEPRGNGRGKHGKFMKSRTAWVYNGNGTNSIGFNALPAGGHNPGAGIVSFGASAEFWTSSPSRNGAWGRYIIYGKEGVFRGDFQINFGLSCRCLLD